MDVRGDAERQRFAAQFQRVAVLDSHTVEWQTYNVVQILQAGSRAVHNDVRILFDHQTDRARVVRLRVVDNHVINVCKISDRFDIFLEVRFKTLVRTVDQRRFVSALDQVGIVCRAVFRAHDDVEHAQRRVGNTDIIDIVSDFHGMISPLMMIRNVFGSLPPYSSINAANFNYQTRDCN